VGYALVVPTAVAPAAFVPIAGTVGLALESLELFVWLDLMLEEFHPAVIFS
jgi:hypothetical protein